MHTRVISLIALLACATPAAAQPECEGNPFYCAVERAVRTGLARAVAEERGLGRWDRDFEHNAMGVLAFLSRRDGNSFNGRPRGYEGSPQADQQMLVGVVRALINSTRALRAPDPQMNPIAVGKALMMLSTWLRTGGPDNVGAEVSVVDAVRNGLRAFDAFARAGGWTNPNLSAEAFAFGASGLSAAVNIIDGPQDILRVLIEAADLRTAPDGSVNDSVIATLSVALARRRAHQPASGDAIQAHLQWLLPQYADFDQDAEPYLALWLWRTLLARCFDDRQGGAVYSEAFVVLVPEDHAVNMPPGFEFDIAWRLIGWQDLDDFWGGRVGPERDVWARQFFAVLTLSQYVEFGHPDTDDDGLVDVDDNCPEVGNSNQSDRDDDRVGDVCDNCPDIPNRDQVDENGDGIGDACAGVEEVCEPEPVECNGIDEDCDGSVDEDCVPEAGVIEDMGVLDARVADAEADGSPIDPRCLGSRLDCAVQQALDAGYAHYLVVTDDPRQPGLSWLSIAAFLSRRQAVGGRGLPIPFDAMNAGERRLIRDSLARLIDISATLNAGQFDPSGGERFLTFSHTVRALSLWRARGGPNDVGASMTVSAGLASAMTALAHLARGDWADAEWEIDTLPNLAVIIDSLTQVAGLLDGVEPIIQSAATYAAGQLGEDGIGPEFTVPILAGVLIRLRAGDPVAAVRPSLAFLQRVWRGAWATANEVRKLWLWRAVLRDVLGRADAMFEAAEFTRNDPSEEGFADAEAGFEFDIALALLRQQNADGTWGVMGTRHTATPWALMTLSLPPIGQAPDPLDTADSDGGATDATQDAGADGAASDQEQIRRRRDPGCASAPARSNSAWAWLLIAAVASRSRRRSRPARR